MTINFHLIFITNLVSKKIPSACQMKEKSCLKASAWWELAECHLKLSIKYL